MTLSDVARELGRSPSTVRKWVRDGCPTVSLGSVGRGNGTDFDLQEVVQWVLEQKVPKLAKRSDTDMLSIIATALDDWLKRDGWAGQTISSEHAALSFYERVYKNLTHQPLELKDLPSQLERVRAILLESVEQGNFQRR